MCKKAKKINSKTNKYIYINLILIIIIIIIIIIWESFPARVLCPGGVCVAGSRGLLKFSQPGRYWQAWQILASLENTGSGAGGRAVLGDIFLKE